MTEMKVADAPGASEAHSNGVDAHHNRNNEVVTYTAPWMVYALSFSCNPHFPCRLAVGSFIESRNNKVEIIQLNEASHQFEILHSFEHTYPPTKVMWVPDITGSREDLLATSSDCMRIWRYEDGKATVKSSLINHRNLDYSSPLTSFDWNPVNLALIGTSSIDTTCTIWDVEKEAINTQLIAHDKEVYDIAFAHGVHVFASAGADGSVRQFDLRALEHSNILYESNNYDPLLRLAWNKVDENYLATIMMDSHTVTILDVRAPAIPVAELIGHRSAVNALAWAPHSSCHICTAGDDSMALIWDLQGPVHSRGGDIYIEPILTYAAEAEISTLQWAPAQNEWIAIAFNRSVQTLRV